MNSLISLVSVVLVFGLILVLAYLVSRALVKTWHLGHNSKYMKIIDQMVVGQDRQILIVRIKDRHYLIGSSSKGVELLKELEGDFPDTDGVGTGGENTGSFLQYYHLYQEKYKELLGKHKFGKK